MLAARWTHQKMLVQLRAVLEANARVGTYASGEPHGVFSNLEAPTFISPSVSL